MKDKKEKEDAIRVGDLIVSTTGKSAVVTNVQFVDQIHDLNGDDHILTVVWNSDLGERTIPLQNYNLMVKYGKWKLSKCVK